MSERILKSMTVKTFIPKHIKHPEDDFFCVPPFFGVIDGYSEPYWPGKPQISFSGDQDTMITGGQMAVWSIKNAFENNPEMSLSTLARRANSEIRRQNIEMGLTPEDPGVIPGASFIIVRISHKPKEIAVAQSGDCLAVWCFPNGKIDYTLNPVYKCEMERLDMIDQLTEKYQRNQGKMWEEFGPWLVENRRRVVNNQYPIFNGMKNAPELLRIYHINEIPQTLIIFTDGLVGCQKTKRMDLVAEQILNLHSQGGLEAVFEEAEKIETKDMPKHIAGGRAEKTAIALEFWTS